MRKLPHVFAFLIALLCGATSTAASLSDHLVAELLQNHLPKQLYEQGNNPWPGGQYRLQVFKHGRPEVTSAAERIHVQMPLRIELVGTAANDLLGFKADCDSSFVAVGEITLTPRNAGEGPALQSAIQLPIPPVKANCNSLQFPIESYLKAFVAQNKAQWEQRLDREINSWLAP